jgi:hypothetical protein
MEKSGASAGWPVYYPIMDLRIVTVAERPTMKSSFVSAETEPWPAFMNEDPISCSTTATTGSRTLNTA